MQDRWTVDGVTEAERIVPPRRRLPWGQVLSVVVGLVGVAALAASAWVYSSTQRDIKALATDIAQLRVSLDLYAQQGGDPAAGTGSQALLDLSNRLSILEGSWRDDAGAAPATAALPALPATAPASSIASGDDCLPTGTRFMVAAGDSYPVCGSTAVIEIGAVDDGYISLVDGTVIAQGGNIAMPGTGCMLGVLPSEDSAVSGFAEIRVTC